MIYIYYCHGYIQHNSMTLVDTCIDGVSILRTARSIHDFVKRSARVQRHCHTDHAECDDFDVIYDRFIILEAYEAAHDDADDCPALFVVYNCAQHDCAVVDAGMFLCRARFDCDELAPEELRCAYDRLQEMRDNRDREE